jgi:hypothetical protein
LKIKYYSRYVDDFILIHKSKEYLLKTIDEIRLFLSDNLTLTLHSKKIYFQHFTKWVSFLWAFILPHRIYIWTRLKANFYKVIHEINLIITKNKSILSDKQTQKTILSKINSYLGLIRHYDSFTLRKKFLFLLNAYLWNYFYISNEYRLLVEKIRYV